MQSIINGLKNYRLALGVTVFAAALAGSLVLSISPAQAQWEEFGDYGSIGGDFGGGFDGGDFTGGDWSGSGWGDTGGCEYGCGGDFTGGDWSGYGWGDTGSCEYGCGSDYGYDYDYGYDDDYDYGYDDDYGYGSGYSSGSGSSGYSTGGYSYGGSTGGSYYVPPQYHYPTPKPSKTSTPSQTCVNNSCNTSVVNNTNIKTNIIDSFNGQSYAQYQPDYDVCYNLPGIQKTAPYGYYTHGGNCVQSYTTPYPTAQPYVSLSAVPYTGLEMGPMATALYWGFLVLWCLVAAYLIAVKKVQNKLVSGINGFLFPAAVTAGHSAHSTSVATRAASVAAETNSDAIDPFIQSQINRAR